MELFSHTLAGRIAARKDALTGWFNATRERVRPPFTASVDLRDSGYKIVPVDTNVFPGGFNNLCSGDLDLASDQFKTAVRRLLGEGVSTIGIVAESHTSNLPYFANLLSLQKILETAGFKVEVLSFAEELARERTEVSVSGEKLELHRAHRSDSHLGSADLKPDLLVLNNDLSAGIPEQLAQLDQPLVPAPNLGWWRRRKSTHFAAYNRLAAEVADVLDVDPWQLTTAFETASGVDFATGEGLDAAAESVDRICAASAAEHERRGISDKPYAVVKSDAGTYGMAVMVADSGEELLQLNRKERNRMSVSKGGRPVSEVIIQEGIPTVDEREGKASEPVFYLVGGEVIGGFFRMNAKKGARENLNSRGMEFKQICYHSHMEGNPEGDAWRLSHERVISYALVSQIAALAVGVERTQYENESPELIAAPA